MPKVMIGLFKWFWQLCMLKICSWNLQITVEKSMFHHFKAATKGNLPTKEPHLQGMEDEIPILCPTSPIILHEIVCNV